ASLHDALRKHPPRQQPQSLLPPATASLRSSYLRASPSADTSPPAESPCATNPPPMPTAKPLIAQQPLPRKSPLHHSETSLLKPGLRALNPEQQSADRTTPHPDPHAADTPQSTPHRSYREKPRARPAPPLRSPRASSGGSPFLPAFRLPSRPPQIKPSLLLPVSRILALRAFPLLPEFPEHGRRTT